MKNKFASKTHQFCTIQRQIKNRAVLAKAFVFVIA